MTLGTWDASYGNNGNVIAWYEDKDTDGLSECYISSVDGCKLRAPKDCKELFKRIGYYIAYDEDPLVGLNLVDWSSMEVCDGMFSDAFGGGRTNFVLDLSNLDTRNVTTMKDMFYFCGEYGTGLKQLKLGGLFNTIKVKDMSGMFRNLR